jgi:hypothetical protein
VKGAKRGTIENHRRIQSPNQIRQLCKRKKQARLTENSALNINERRLSVKVSHHMLKAVERQKNGLRDHPGWVLEDDKRLTLVLDAPGHHGPEFRSLE